MRLTRPPVEVRSADYTPYDYRVVGAFDPSTTNLGWAFVRVCRLTWKVERLGSGVHTIRRGSVGDRSFAMGMKAGELAKQYGANVCVVEEPQVFGGNSRANADGAVLKLGMVHGMVAMAVAACGVSVVRVPVGRWKGQSPKSVTAARVAKFYGIDVSGMKDDETDALGLIRWFLLDAGYRTDGQRNGLEPRRFWDGILTRIRLNKQ